MRTDVNGGGLPVSVLCRLNLNTEPKKSEPWNLNYRRQRSKAKSKGVCSQDSKGYDLHPAVK